MGENFCEVLKLIGYIAIAVVIGAVGILAKESIGWMFDLLAIVLGWGFLIWMWIKK